MIRLIGWAMILFGVVGAVVVVGIALPGVSWVIRATISSIITTPIGVGAALIVSRQR